MVLTEADQVLLAARLSDVQRKAVLRWLEESGRGLPAEKRAAAAHLYVLMSEAFRREPS